MNLVVRFREAEKLKWTDVDFKSNIVRITPEKSSNQRIFKVSSKLTSMLANLPKKSVNIYTYKNKFTLERALKSRGKG